jgi:hypothetical protein
MKKADFVYSLVHVFRNELAQRFLAFDKSASRSREDQCRGERVCDHSRVKWTPDHRPRDKGLSSNYYIQKPNQSASSVSRLRYIALTRERQDARRHGTKL